MNLIHTLVGRKHRSTRFAGLNLVGLILLVATLFAGTTRLDAAQYELFVDDGSITRRALPGTPDVPMAMPATRSRAVTPHAVFTRSDILTPGDAVRLDLFADKSYDAVVDSVSSNVNGTVTVRARIAGSAAGYMLISTTDGQSLAKIHVPESGERYLITGSPDNSLHYLMELDGEMLDIVDTCSDPLESAPDATAEPQAGARTMTESALGPNDPAVVDVMIVYTPAARDWAGGDAGIANVIAQALELGSTTLANSQVSMTVNLVHTALIDYTESGSSSTDLSRLTSRTDGHMDEVHALRDQYGADLVSLFARVGDTGGIAWLLNNTSGSPQNAFSLSRVQQAGWTYTAIHEMCHNMGLHHHKAQTVQAGPGLYSYSAGWRWVGNDAKNYCSIMTYETGSAFSDGQNHTRVAHVSNPSVTHQGRPTGHSADGDGARSLREIKHVIAGYRENTNPPPTQFTLTYSAGTGGTISGTSPQTVSQGGSGTAVTAVPNTGYSFVQWSDGVLTATRQDTNVTANKSVTAQFAINQYTLTYTAGSNGSISGTSPQTVNHGANGTSVTAVPSTGYSFVQWSDGVQTATRQDTNVTANKSVTASFAINQYTLTYSAGSNGSISGTSPQTVNHGANGTSVTAVPNTGYSFSQWSDGIQTATRQDTNVTANKSVSAQFTADQAEQFTLTYNAGTGGTISGATVQTVESGSDGTPVTAVPSTGYHFVQWSDGVQTATRQDANVTANKTVTASFAINQYTLTYTAGSNGSISGTSPQTVNHGANGTSVTAVPNTGYYFVQWSDGVQTATRQDTNVTANKSVTASFAINQYTLTYTAGSNGSISGTSPQTVNHGANGTSVTAVPNTGYHFVQWSDGVQTATRQDANVTANKSVTASFAINQYTLVYSSGSNGSISGTSPQVVNHGANGTSVTAVPNTGYSFTQWSDGVQTATRQDTNVTGNISVTAQFTTEQVTQYTLTYSAPGNQGSITGTASQTVEHGGSGTPVTASPKVGYSFTRWSDGVQTATRQDTNVTANISVSAEFAIAQLTLTYIAGPGGSISGVATQTVNYNSHGQSVTATPDTGYRFVQWSDGNTTARRRDLNVKNDITVTALFEAEAAPQYTLTYSAGTGGTISGNTSQTVNEGGSGTAVTAVPSTGYSFVQWSDGVLTAVRQDTNVTGPINVTATFASDQGDHYTLTYVAGAHGIIAGTTPQIVESGSDGTAVSAIPDTGFSFVQWSDGVLTPTRIDTNVTGNISVTAVFADLTPPASILDPRTKQTNNASTIGLPFSSNDDGSGVAYTELWVKTPSSAALAPTGIILPGTSGTFDYTFTDGRGRYEFATRSTDNAGNTENAPTSAELSLVVNTAKQSLYTWIVTNTTWVESSLSN